MLRLWHGYKFEGWRGYDCQSGLHASSLSRPPFRKLTRPSLDSLPGRRPAVPTGHSLLCRQYWSGDDAYRPPWCKPGSLMGLEGEWDRAHERPGS